MSNYAALYLLVDTSVLDSLISKLNCQFELLIDIPGGEEDNEDSKMTLMKSMIQQLIKKGIQSESDREKVKKYLTKLYSDLFLSKEIYEWALDKINPSVPQISSGSASDAPEEQVESIKPLFCEDTVYHASLCCYAVGTRDATNYTKFFSENKHQFDELSLSRSRDNEDVDRYILAKKGKTYYLAFLSEPLFSEWLKKFNSFEHGQLKPTHYYSNL